jgi:hypothetical protein
MATEFLNPYRRGKWHLIFSFIMMNQPVSKSKIIVFAVRLGMTPIRALYAIDTLLSPKERSVNGREERGAYGCMGHLYFASVVAPSSDPAGGGELRWEVHPRVTTLPQKKRAMPRILRQMELDIRQAPPPAATTSANDTPADTNKETANAPEPQVP